ncbi:hypothetical protein ACFLR7_02380 [Acidobacteriota bacterium]
MRNLVLRISMHLMILGFGSSLIAIDVPLKFTKLTPDKDSIYSTGFMFMRDGWESKFKELKLPEFVDERPLYSQTIFGDKQLLMVFDREKPGDYYYNLLYLDKNNNHDLTDDTVYRGVKVDSQNERVITIEFPAIEIDIDINGETFPYCFKPSVVRAIITGGRPNVAMRPYCYYLGEFQYQGRKYYVALGDQTYNGRFDDIYKVRPNRGAIGGGIVARGDKFFISNSSDFDNYDSLGLGKWLVIGDELFEVNVDMSERILSLTPVEENLASLSLSAKPERLSLYNKETDDFIMLYQPKDKVLLNPGWYCLYSYEMFKNDQGGDLWRLNANGSSHTPFIEADEEGGILRLGEPYTPKVEVKRDNRTTRVILTFITKGLGGEIVQELVRVEGTSTNIELSTVDRYSQRPKEPSYKITKADGEIVAQGNFEYG